MPYQYRFGTAGTFGATNSWSGLNSGTYTVRMQDANGCTANASIVISQPPALTIAITKTDESCPNARNGSIIANGVGGSSPYTYRFGTVGAYSSNNTFNNLRAASYRVFINDANSCGGNSVAVVIAQLSATCFTANATARTVANKVESTNTSLNISLSPNPSRSNFSLLIRSSKQDAVTIRVMDVNGKIVYAAKGMPEQSIHFGDALMSSVYLVEVRQGDEVKMVKAVKIR